MALNKTIAAQAKGVLSQEISGQNLPAKFLDLAMLQIAHETAGFNSRVSKVNNLSGIKYNKNGYAKDSGIKSPEGNNYAAYDSLNLWAKDYLRIVKRSGAQNAKSIDEFAAKLKAAGYYTDSLTNYTKALKSWQSSIGKVVSEFAAGNPIKTGVTIIILFSFIIFLNSK